MFTRAFWTATAERAVKTAAQTAAALLVAAGTGLLDSDWTATASVSGMAALLSVLTSIGSAGVGNPGPSLTTEELTPGA